MEEVEGICREGQGMTRCFSYMPGYRDVHFLFVCFLFYYYFFEQVSISSPVLCFFSFCLSFYSFLLSSFLLPGPRVDIQDSEMTQ